MIRTKLPQIIDAMNRIEEIVYIRAWNRQENGEKQTVSFDVECFILKNNEVSELVEKNGMRYELDGNGDTIEVPYIYFETVIMIKPYLYRVSTRKAVYKMSTFYSLIGNVLPSQYDDILIEQIAYVNTRVLTGNEVQPNIYFWTLGITDLEKVSIEVMTSLLEPYEKI